ncbi:MAG: polysaccharide deacetylase family protein [Bacteroidota bacterium]
MKPYFVQTSRIISDVLYPSLHWKVPVKEKQAFITFDDGPTPGVTEQTLEILSKYNAKATFFLIGDKVKRYPQLVDAILSEGHATGNHTFHHLNGWKTEDNLYFQDIFEADELIRSPFFRPPHGKISRNQVKHLKEQFHIIMWSLLSADFDTSITPQNCYKNIKKKIGPGSIVVFHDSEKASKRMLYALPALLDELSESHYTTEALNRYHFQ